MSIEINPVRSDRDVMPYDIAIIGGGPAGLSCAIKLKQLLQESGTDLSICVLEKGSEIGAHLMSGAVLETRALNELIPDWREKNAPLRDPVKKDRFVFLTKTKSFVSPILPPQMRNHGNYIVSLGEFGKWLAQQAESMGVDIFPGFAASELLYDDKNRVIGVATGDLGLDRHGARTDRFTAGVEIHAKQIILAEGCHGSLSKQLIQKFNLRLKDKPQTYGLGIKEIWEIPAAQHQAGLVTHTVGWPMDHQTYGGSFMYHYGDNKVSLGFVTGLDYRNPHLSPFEEMQRWKTHPEIAKVLAGGRRVAYGARTIVEGGLQGLPKLQVPGALLIGDAAGFLNVPKIKGNHAAMKSGMIAAEALYAQWKNDPELTRACQDYTARFKKSWLYKELHAVRNIRPGFRWGFVVGMLNATFETLLGGRTWWTLSHHADDSALQRADKMPKIAYPKPDGVLTFDRLSSVYLTNTNHAEEQPCHLQLKDPSLAVDVNLKLYDSPESRYCPAAVYEIVYEGAEQTPRLQINAQNCIHCKTCDIKDPRQNINWVPPQGGEGPNYAGM
jgi:electron-transferring-flavoprotein dehydrogenase